MISEEKIIARGFATPEEAFAPLRLALPWMKSVEGDVVIPRSKFVFQHGEGRGKIRYCVSVTAEKKGDAFDVVLSIDRLRTREVVVFLAQAAALFLLVGFTRPEMLWVVIPMVVTVGAISFSYCYRHISVVIDTFALPYSQPNKSVQTTAMTPPPSTTLGAPLSDL